MRVELAFFGIMFLFAVGCCEGEPGGIRGPNPNSKKTIAAPSAKTFHVTAVGRVNFPNGDSALVLNYETGIRIQDKKSLRREADAIWEFFRTDVEKAGLKSGVIRAVHYEGTGFLRRGTGYGFVFTKGDDGKWRLLSEDNGKEWKGGSGVQVVLCSVYELV